MMRVDVPIKIEDAVKALTYTIAAIGFLSVLRYAELPYSMLFAGLCLLSLYFEYQRKFLVPRWMLNTATVLLVAVTLLKMSMDNLVVPAIDSLLVLLAIKLLEDKQFRDYMQIYVISVFLLAGSSLMSMDIIFLVYFISLFFLLTLTTVFLAYYSQDRSITVSASTGLKIAVTSLAIAGISLPATIFLFIILPRTNYPFLNFLNRGGATTGFSEKVSLGGVAGIQEDTSTILRVNMKKIDDRYLYWRGIILDHFDGTTWKSSLRETDEAGKGAVISGRLVHQIIYLEPYDGKYLFALDRPVSLVMRNAKKLPGFTYAAQDVLMRRVRYQAMSFVSDVMPEKKIRRGPFLQLPAMNRGKIGELVDSLTFGMNDAEKVRAILSYLGRGEYRYSLSRLPLSKDPLNDFLFTSKYGNCEYFASAMAVMLRMAGVPARVIGGYRGGFYNETGNYYLVPQSNAHVWVEAHVEGVGWLRVDPTPGAMGSFVRAGDRGLLFRARLFLDTLNYYWNASVVNFDMGSQISLLMGLKKGLSLPSLLFVISREVAGHLAAFLLSIGTCCLLLYYLIAPQKPLDRRVLEAFHRKMKKLGYERTNSEGLEEFVARIEEDGTRQRAGGFVCRFQELYYQDKKIGKLEMARLRQLIRDI
jgi:transglutaminase-like putative cysteine protease